MSAAPASAGEALLAAVAALTGLLEQENDALAKADRERVRQLADAKHKACGACEDAARVLRAGAAVPDPRLRQRLRPALVRLADVSTVNRRRLAAALAAHRRLMELVAEALRTCGPAPAAYAPGGASAGRAGLAMPPPALQFDEAL